MRCYVCCGDFVGDDAHESGAFEGLDLRLDSRVVEELHLEVLVVVAEDWALSLVEVTGVVVAEAFRRVGDQKPSEVRQREG